MLKALFVSVVFSVLAFAQLDPQPPVPELTSFSSSVNIVVFNIQKAENRAWDSEVFKELVERSDLVLIQESTDQFEDFKFKRASYVHFFYKSWGNSSYNTGVSTLSRVPFDESKRMLSKDKEPVAGTPKVSSIEKYSVKGIEGTLTVVNTHGINFTGLSAFRRQMSAIAEDLKGHTGPLIWAGDFNTWSKRRKQYLDSVMKDLDLEEVDFANRSETAFVLDRVYTRGVQVSDAEQLQLGISDHEPLQFKIELTPVDSI